MAKVRVSVTMNVPKLREIGRHRLRKHIEDAIEAWCGLYLSSDRKGKPDPLYYGIKDVKAEKIEVLK